MTAEEIRKQYQISKAALDVYNNQVKMLFEGGIVEEENYEDQDIERIGMVMTFHRMGFEDPEIGMFFRLEQEGETTKEQRLLMLKRHRLHILDEIHQKEKILEELDYLLHELNMNGTSR